MQLALNERPACSSPCTACPRPSRGRSRCWPSHSFRPQGWSAQASHQQQLLLCLPPDCSHTRHVCCHAMPWPAQHPPPLLPVVSAGLFVRVPGLQAALAGALRELQGQLQHGPPHSWALPAAIVDRFQCNRSAPGQLCSLCQPVAVSPGRGRQPGNHTMPASCITKRALSNRACPCAFCRPSCGGTRGRRIPSFGLRRATVQTTWPTSRGAHLCPSLALLGLHCSWAATRLLLRAQALPCPLAHTVWHTPPRLPPTCRVQHAGRLQATLPAA